MLGRRSPTHTGIHFGADAVYAVGVTRRRGRLSLTHCSAVALEKAPRLPEQLADEDGRRPLAAALRELRALGLPRSRPCLALAGPATLVRRRPVLPGAGAGSREHLRWEAGELLGADLKDYVVDLLVTPRYGYVTAARREIFDRWAALCRESGLDPPRFEMASFALCRARADGAGAPGEGEELILHAEAGGVCAVLLRDGEYEAERTRSSGGGLAASLAEMCEQELGPGKEPRALWLSGAEGPARAAAVAGLAATVAPLDPFGALARSPGASRGLAASGRPSCAFAVAAGLAYRSASKA